MWTKRGVSRAQGTFIRAFLKAGGSLEELLEGKGMSETTFAKWMKDGKFAGAMEEARAVLALIRELEMEMGALMAVRRLEIGLFDQVMTEVQRKSALVLARLPRKLDGRKKRLGDGKVVSEREWVYSMTGEEGVKAYDELVKMREERKRREESMEKGKR